MKNPLSKRPILECVFALFQKIMDTDDNERFSDEQFERDKKMIRNILSGSPQTEDIDENCVY